MSGYRGDVADALSGSAIFGALYATGPVVRTVLIGPDGSPGLISAPVVEGSVPSIVDLAPAAGWDEREAADLYGVGFNGHSPMRPLVAHGAALEDWTVRVSGHDAYQVAVGPIHAGVIESGHFRFHVVGDRILHLDAQLFYKHRGLQAAAEGRRLREAMALVARTCAACSVTNAIAYADACEQVLALEPPSELRRVRTILVELERVWNHLNDVSAICAGVGMAAGNAAFAALTERARRLNDALTGHRFLRGAVQVGASDLDWDASAVRRAANELDSVRTDAARAWRELAFNASFQDRLAGVGVIDAGRARALGVVGPAARAAGLDRDERCHSGRLSYDGFAPALPERPDGDVRARYEQRALELWQSFDLLGMLLDRPVTASRAEPGPAVRIPGAGPGDETGIGVVEGPRGRTVCILEARDGQVIRLQLRTASFANWPAVAAAAAGSLLPDFPLINKSFELCYACVDR